LLLALSALAERSATLQFSALGFLPSLLALTLYSMLPIIRNGVKEPLTATPLFAAHFAHVLDARARLVAVSPDAGGIERARAFADELAERTGRAVDAAFVEKHRSEGRVAGDLFAGVLAERSAVVLGGEALASLVVTGTVPDVHRRCADSPIGVDVLERAPLIASAIERLAGGASARRPLE
jgi:phosphoribosylpyrophosphate synthetase